MKKLMSVGFAILFAVSLVNCSKKTPNGPKAGPGNVTKAPPKGGVTTPTNIPSTPVAGSTTVNRGTYSATLLANNVEITHYFKDALSQRLNDLRVKEDANSRSLAEDLAILLGNTCVQLVKWDYSDQMVAQGWEKTSYGIEILASACPASPVASVTESPFIQYFYVSSGVASSITETVFDLKSVESPFAGVGILTRSSDNKFKVDSLNPVFELDYANFYENKMYIWSIAAQ